MPIRHRNVSFPIFSFPPPFLFFSFFILSSSSSSSSSSLLLLLSLSTPLQPSSLSIFTFFALISSSSSSFLSSLLFLSLPNPSRSASHPLSPTSFSLSVVACVDHQGYQLLLQLVDAKNFVSIPLLCLLSCLATTLTLPVVSSVVLSPSPALVNASVNPFPPVSTRTTNDQKRFYKQKTIIKR